MDSQQTTIHCKISFENQLRRASLSSLTYPDLEALVRSLFSLPLQKLSLKYKDEEDDLITLSTDNELLTAISSLPPNQLFRITVTLEPSISQSHPIPSSISPWTDKRKFKCMKHQFKRMKVENSELAHHVKHEHKHFKKALKSEKHQEKAAFISQYNSTFVPKCLTVPSIPSSVQPVSLTITNRGSASWPEGTMLMRVGKWKNGEKTVLPGSVPPGTDVSLTMYVQLSDTGCHMSKWRLVLPNGAKFGDKFFVKSQNFSPRPHCHKKQFHHRRFSEGIIAIRQMGFQGGQVCHLMREHDGDVDRVVAELVSQPQ